MVNDDPVSSLPSDASSLPGGMGCFVTLVLGGLGFLGFVQFGLGGHIGAGLETESELDAIVAFARGIHWAAEQPVDENPFDPVIVEDDEIPLDAPDAPDAPEEPAPLTPIVSSEEWQFTEFEGQMVCDGGVAVTIPRSAAYSVNIARLEDGRLLGSGVGDGLGEVLLVMDQDAPGTYVGTLVQDYGVEGVELEFTITFNDDLTADTHIGGELVTDVGKCSVDRHGEAIVSD